MRLYSREQKSTVFLMFTLVDFAKKIPYTQCKCRLMTNNQMNLCQQGDR